MLLQFSGGFMVTNSTHARHALPVVSIALLVGALGAAWGPLSRAGAGGGNKKEIVIVSATATKPDAEGRQQITFVLDIKPGVYLWANPVQNPDLEAARTTIRFPSQKRFQSAKIEYPPGKRVMEGQDIFYLYEGKTVIKALVTRMAGDNDPVEAIVRCYPFSKVLSYGPEEIKVKID
jgi:hypothetical protein